MTPNFQPAKYHIHGDNIVECERTFALIVEALKSEIISLFEPTGSPVCPVFGLLMKGESLPITFTFFPGYGRWDKDIRSLVQQGGGTLREAADTILTEVTPFGEKPLIAIEYCGALPAGNQAWQRSGRAYAFAKANIPYLYLTEIGGIELDANRKPIAPRFPNPAVPFSYLNFSLTTGGLVLPVFLPGAGATQNDLWKYRNTFGMSTLTVLLRKLLFKQPITREIRRLEQKTLLFVHHIASAKKNSSSLTGKQWSEAYSALGRQISLGDYILSLEPMRWAKITSIKTLTPTMKKVMSLGTTHAIGLTSSNLPFCLLSAQERHNLTLTLRQIYPNLPSDFIQWLNHPIPLTLCWVMGFKLTCPRCFSPVSVLVWAGL